jgi:hypothetical protein
MPSTNKSVEHRRARFADILKKRVSPHTFFDEDRRCFKINTPDGPRTAKGLVPTLKQIFYKNYKYEQPKYSRGKRIPKPEYGGQMRGSIVHKQLMMYANKYSIEEFSKQFMAIHPYSIKAFQFLKTNNWDPITAELAIGDTDLMIATAIDMVCMDQNGKVILIEWKTGMDYSMLRGTTQMDGPVHEDDCPLNQAFLQLLFGKIILEMQYGIRSDEEYVVQIKHSGVVEYRIPSTFLGKKNALYNYAYSMMCKQLKPSKKNKSKYF